MEKKKYCHQLELPVYRIQQKAIRNTIMKCFKSTLPAKSPQKLQQVQNLMKKIQYWGTPGNRCIGVLVCRCIAVTVYR